jgi:hypothetical protein
MTNRGESDLPVSSRVVFFLGAGASRDAGVPTTLEFTTQFLQSLETSQRSVLQKLVNSMVRVEKGADGSKRVENVDVETLMATLEQLRDWPTETLSKLVLDSSIRAEFDLDYGGLSDELRTFIRRKCSEQVTSESVEYLDPLAEFLATTGCRPLDIFSTNYDLCIELFAKNHRLRCRDGFDPFWNPTDFEKSDADIRLYKIHGSINWLQTTSGEYVKTVTDAGAGKVKLLTGDSADPLILYPAKKWQYQEPQLENLVTLKRKLESESCEMVVVVGYSFRDDSIREIFWDAARTNRKSTFILIAPHAYETYYKRLKYYKEGGNASSLSGRVVCLPFTCSKSMPYLRLRYVKGLREAESKFQEASKAELDGQPSAYWSLCLLEYARAFHLEKTEAILSEKLGLTPYDGKDDNSEIHRWNGLLLSRNPISSADIVMALYYRVLWYGLNFVLSEYRSSLGDFIKYIRWLFLRRCIVSFVEPNVVLSTILQPNIAPELQHYVDLNALLSCFRSAYYEYSLFPFDIPKGSRAKWDSLNWGKTINNLHYFFQRFEKPTHIDEYISRIKSNLPPDLEASYNAYKNNEDAKLAADFRNRLSDSIAQRERSKFDQISHEIIEFAEGKSSTIPLRYRWGEEGTE